MITYQTHAQATLHSLRELVVESYDIQPLPSRRRWTGWSSCPRANNPFADIIPDALFNEETGEWEANPYAGPVPTLDEYGEY